MKSISNTELKQFSEEITDTCFVRVEKNGDNGILYYKGGNIINACINNTYGKTKANEILTWKDAKFRKVKIDSVSKFQSEDLKYVFDIIEFNGLSADVYLKQKGNIIVLSFSEGYLISVIPEVEVNKDFIKNLTNIKNQKVKMKLTGEKTGSIKVFVNELLNE